MQKNLQNAQVILMFLNSYIPSDSELRHSYILVNVKLVETPGPTLCTHET